MSGSSGHNVSHYNIIYGQLVLFAVRNIVMSWVCRGNIIP
jgi:hypothetical protein